jgi:hypothetical protein
MEQVEAGEQQAAKLVDAISATRMAANYRIFGNLCGRECQMLTLQHTRNLGHLRRPQPDKVTVSGLSPPTSGAASRSVDKFLCINSDIGPGRS